MLLLRLRRCLAMDLGDSYLETHHYVALEILGFTSLSHLILLLHRNGLLSGNGLSRAIAICHRNVRDAEKAGQHARTTLIRVRLILPRPFKAIAEQYISMWQYSLSLRSRAQTHPFMVTCQLATRPSQPRNQEISAPHTRRCL